MLFETFFEYRFFLKNHLECILEKILLTCSVVSTGGVHYEDDIEYTFENFPLKSFCYFQKKIRYRTIKYS